MGSIIHYCFYTKIIYNSVKEREITAYKVTVCTSLYLWYLCGFSFQSADTRVLSGSLLELWRFAFHPGRLVPTRRTGKSGDTWDFGLNFVRWSRYYTSENCHKGQQIKVFEVKSSLNRSFTLIWLILTKSRADPPPKYSIIIHNFVPWKINQEVSQSCSSYNRGTVHSYSLCPLESKPLLPKYLPTFCRLISSVQPKNDIFFKN